MGGKGFFKYENKEKFKEEKISGFFFEGLERKFLVRIGVSCVGLWY